MLQNWIYTLVMNTIVTTILILILSGLTFLLKTKLAPGVRYFLWVAILFSLLVPIRPIFGQGVVKISSSSFEEGGTTGTLSSNLDFQSPYSFWASINNLPWIQILLAFWLILTLFFLGKQLFAYWKLKQMIKRWGKPITEASYIKALN